MEIMMAGPMVRRLKDGTKTQTRRTGARWTKVKPGDVLHVREAFAPPCERVGRERTIYAADWGDDPPNPRWTPAVHMPLSLVRMRLLVKRAWRERVDDISEADAITEGMERVTVDDLLEMAGGSKIKCLRAFRDFKPEYLRVREWDTIESDWRVLTEQERFRLVLAVLGAKPDDVVTAIEFEVIHDHR